MNELENKLSTMKTAYAGATRRAARAWALLEELRTKRVFVKAREALDSVADAVYYSNRYDAHERYDSIEEFKDELKKDLAKLFTIEDIDGVPMYVVTPFFSDNSDFLNSMGLGYVRGYCGLKELAGLNVAPLKTPEPISVLGLSDAEFDVLTSHYRRSTLTLVNLMRKTCTALRYVRCGIANEHRSAPAYPGAVKDPGIDDLVAALAKEVELPFEPTPATCFGTEADTRNVLRALPEGAGLKSLLETP